MLGFDRQVHQEDVSWQGWTAWMDAFCDNNNSTLRVLLYPVNIYLPADGTFCCVEAEVTQEGFWFLSSANVRLARDVEWFQSRPYRRLQTPFPSTPYSHVLGFDAHMLTILNLSLLKWSCDWSSHSPCLPIVKHHHYLCVCCMACRSCNWQLHCYLPHFQSNGHTRRTTGTTGRTTRATHTPTHGKRKPWTETY